MWAHQAEFFHKFSNYLILLVFVPVLLINKRFSICIYSIVCTAP